MNRRLSIAVVAALAVGASVAEAQSGGRANGNGERHYPLRPNKRPIYCHAGDAKEVARIEIKTDLYNRATMISPKQAKALALCAVPGQIASGEMQSDGKRTWYDISLLPEDKKTYTKIQIDAATGEVINAKQFGGLRGLAGFLRESAERKENKDGAP